MMKKLLILAVLSICIAKFGFTQSDEFVMTWPIVANEAKKSDAEVANPKKALKLKTWTERGRKYIEVYTFDLKGAYSGMLESEILTFMKTTAKNTREENGTKIYEYDRINLIFKDGKLTSYERKGNDVLKLFPDKTSPLDTATQAYLQAKKLDVDNKKSGMIANQLSILISLYLTEGNFYFQKQDVENAAVFYTKAGNILKTKYDNNHDTVRANYLFYCGAVCQNGKKLKEAIEFYQMSMELSVKPKFEIIGYIAQSYLELKDTASAINTYKNAIEKYPNEKSVTDYFANLIKLYIDGNQVNNAILYLTKAIEKDPTNVVYIFNTAYLYAQVGKVDLAKEYYAKAIAVNPSHEDSYLNLGILYRDAAKKKLDEASAAFNTKKYKGLVDEGKKLLRQAYPSFEKLAELTSDNLVKYNAYKDLESIYQQLDMQVEYKATKAKRDALKKK